MRLFLNMYDRNYAELQRHLGQIIYTTITVKFKKFNVLVNCISIIHCICFIYVFYIFYHIPSLSNRSSK